MPDLLSHALIGYGLGTLLSIRYDWLDAPWVTVLMIGAILPDVDKMSILVTDATMEQWLGVPFSWTVIHLPVGSLILCLLGTLLVDSKYRLRVFSLLTLGALSHIVTDQFAVFTTGYSYPQLWPFLSYHFPAADLYQSSDRWPAIISTGFAATAYVAKTQWSQPNQSTDRE